MGNAAFYYDKYQRSAIVYDFTTRRQIGKKNEADNGRYDNKAGKSVEVFAFKTDDEIKAMIDVFDRHIEMAGNDNQRMIARRNKMLFIIGVNVGLRASDLRTLTWDFFFEKMSNGSLRFRDGYSLRPKKTSKHNKYVQLRFNDTVKKVIGWYVSIYPITDVKDYVFKSSQSDNAITVDMMWRVIKGAAKEAGITQNIGTHSLRKSFCRRLYDNAQDKSKALVVLQKILNHSSSLTTLNYIGITNDDMDDAFDNINIGIDWI